MHYHSDERKLRNTSRDGRGEKKRKNHPDLEPRRPACIEKTQGFQYEGVITRGFMYKIIQRLLLVIDLKSKEKKVDY